MIVHRASVSGQEFAGLQIYDYTRGVESSSSVAVIEVPPGGKHDEAWSERSDKYYYVLVGRVHFQVGSHYDLTSGDLCVVPRGQLFAYLNQTQEITRLLLVHTPSFDLGAERFASEAGGR